MKIAGKTDIGRGRAENQDTFRSGSVPGAGAFGLVCDGMGGAHNGRLASAVAADCVEEALFRYMRDGAEDASPRSALTDAVRLANAEVYARSGSGMMGTTAVCALALGEKLHLAHVGDSRAYLLSGGRLRQITRDHSVVQEMLEVGAITQDEARRHPKRNVLTRALGVEPEVKPGFGEWDFTEGDTLLLCTDGLTNMVSFAKIEDVMRGTDFWDIPRELLGAALEAGGDDNITALVMRRDDR